MTKPKRTSLSASVKAMKEAAAATPELAAAEPEPPPAADRPETVVTSINIPLDLLRAIEDAARRRRDRRRLMAKDKKRQGGRASVSEIIVELLTRHRHEIESEPGI